MGPLLLPAGVGGNMEGGGDGSLGLWDPRTLTTWGYGDILLLPADVGQGWHWGGGSDTRVGSVTPRSFGGLCGGAPHGFPPLPRSWCQLASGTAARGS